jgi:hypothetical protein
MEKRWSIVLFIKKCFLSCIDYTALNGRSIKDELQSMWKYTAMAHIKVLFQHLLAGMKTTTETLKKQALISGLDWGPPIDNKKIR